MTFLNIHSVNFLVFSSVLKQFFIPSFPIIQKVQFSKFILAFPCIQKRFLPCHFSASRGCNFLAFLYHFPTSENAFYVSICKSMCSIFSSMAAAYLVALFALFCVRLCVQRCISLLQRCTPLFYPNVRYCYLNVRFLFVWSTPYRSKY